MVDFNVTGGMNAKVDQTKWRKLTPQEIIKEENQGEDIPDEIVQWAQQMAAFSKIPDNVTYEQVDGDIGLDALNKLGIEEEQPAPADSAAPPVEVEDPSAVKDPEATGEESELPADDLFNSPVPGQAAETKDEEAPEDELTLADPSLNTDAEVIRKRKERKGLA